MSENNRVTALTLAAQDTGSADEIVARATTYLAFLDAANPNVAPAEAPKRRGRPPTAAVIEAAPAAPAPAAQAALLQLRTSGYAIPAPAAQIDIFGDDTPAAPPAEITREDLRAALVAAQKATDAATVLGIMKSVAKAETLGAVAKEHYAALKAKADEIAAKKAA